MIGSENLKGFNLKHKVIIFRLFCLSFILSYFSGCSQEYQVEKASWDSSLDYFSEIQEGYDVTYFVEVGTQEAYLGGILEIYKLPKMNYLDRIKVTEIEFFNRVDGLQMCRIWGVSSKSGTSNHLLARNCKDLTDL